MAKMLPRERQLLPIYEDLRCEVSPDRQGWAETARTIGKHLIAMADELEGAKKGEDKCAYCGGLMDTGSTWYRSGHVYCSKGCAEMAGMEQAFPVRSGCGARWPSGTWGQSCLEHCTCIDKVVDMVILRLRDNFGLDI